MNDKELDKIIKEEIANYGSGFSPSMIKSLQSLLKQAELRAELKLWKNFEVDFYPYLPPHAKLDFDKLVAGKEAELESQMEKEG